MATAGAGASGSSTTLAGAGRSARARRWAASAAPARASIGPNQRLDQLARSPRRRGRRRRRAPRCRRVVGGEEVGGVVDGRGLEVDEGAVAVVGVGEALEGDRRQLQPREAAVGPVEHVDPDLLLHHVDLVAEVLLGDRRRGHAVGLEEQRALERLGRQRLEVVRVVQVGRPVEGAAGGLHQPGVLHLRHVRRALEHQVLEEVGEPGAALRLVAHADVVEDADGHHRDAAVGGEHDAQPVVEREALHRVPEGQIGTCSCHAPDPNRGRRNTAVREPGQSTCTPASTVSMSP